jgi:hypothetical protein
MRASSILPLLLCWLSLNLLQQLLARRRPSLGPLGWAMRPGVLMPSWKASHVRRQAMCQWVAGPLCRRG